MDYRYQPLAWQLFQLEQEQDWVIIPLDEEQPWYDQKTESYSFSPAATSYETHAFFAALLEVTTTHLHPTLVLLALPAPTVVTVVCGRFRIQTDEMIECLLQTACLTHSRLNL